MKAPAAMLAVAAMSVLATGTAAEGGDAAAAAALRALAGRGDSPAPAAAVPLGRYREVLERPLFSPTRRPAPPPAEPTATAGPGLPTLHGVMLAKGRRIALVGADGTSAPSRVTEGSRIGDWTVEHIEADRIILRAADGTATPVLLWAAEDRL